MSDLYQTSMPCALFTVRKEGIDLCPRLPATADAQIEESLNFLEHRIYDTFTAQKSAIQAIECSKYFSMKSIIDRTFTAILMTIALPLMLLVGLLILLYEGRPVFYRQTRVGKNGRKFQILKFRTMCKDAERATGVVWSSASDPRVTALGRWLRCSHLDELPQFLNVLAGDMNLIGPRPERPEFVYEFERELPQYAARHKVRPGITGLAQLELGYDQSVAWVQNKTLLDLEYIKTASFFRDVKILLATLPYIAKELLFRLRTDLSLHGRMSNPTTSISVETAMMAHAHRPVQTGFIESKPHSVYVIDRSDQQMKYAS